ncbi:hypothetical protein, partial [Salmonella enterica]|uniref:hypothetical protein n=1 Tax=Salmonella enterica TaxID=28901 RepID=UPI00398C2BCD
NQDLGPFISHEMNRYIALHPFVLDYNDYADCPALVPSGPLHQLYHRTPADGTAALQFSRKLPV